MNNAHEGHEGRRAVRHRVARPVPVTDAMTGEVVGRIANVSETGMLLNASAPLVEDALYQLRFQPHPGGEDIELGAHLLWLGAAHTPGQSWAGLNFLAMPPLQLQALRRWLAMLESDPG